MKQKTRSKYEHWIQNRYLKRYWQTYNKKETKQTWKKGVGKNKVQKRKYKKVYERIWRKTKINSSGTICQLLKYTKTTFTQNNINALRKFKQTVTLPTKVTKALYIYITLSSTFQILIFVDGVRRGTSFMKTNHTLNSYGTVNRIHSC